MQQLEEKIRRDLERIGHNSKSKLRFCLVTTIQNPIYLFPFDKCKYFAQATIDDVSKIFRLRVIKLTDSPYCTIPEHGMHVNYLPFFFHNDAIRYTKKNMVGLPQLKQELDQVTEANILQGSAFVTGPISSGVAWDENVWTKRLVQCIPNYLDPKWQVIFTGKETFDVVQHRCSSIELVSPKMYYLFSDAPDVLVQRQDKTALICNPDGEDECELTHAILENKRQILTMTQFQGYPIPEKIAQVVSALHFLLAAEALKRANEDNLFESNIVVKGLLIQKQYGCYHCEAKVRVIDVKSHDEGLRIEVTISCPNGYGLLDGEILCGNVRRMCCLSTD